VLYLFTATTSLCPYTVWDSRISIHLLPLILFSTVDSCRLVGVVVAQRRCQVGHQMMHGPQPLAAPHMGEPPPPPPALTVVARRPGQGWATTAANGGRRLPPFPDPGALATTIS